jgi:hypothetical protein
MANTLEASQPDLDMETSPRLLEYPVEPNRETADQGDTNAVAIIPLQDNEPTLLEIIQPNSTFETLSSQLQPPCNIQELHFN